MHSGSSPTPFDGVDGGRLAGPEGSHPLEALRADDLLVPSSGEVDGEIVFDAPAVVGVGLTGTIRLRGVQGVRARGARLRLVGLRLAETRRSESEMRGNTRVTESWVQADGSLFVEDAFLEPALPAQLAAGQVHEARFAIPMPQLGPPSAHLRSAIVAWAVEVRWDIAMGTDAHLARLLPLAQNVQLIRAGVGDQGGEALLASLAAGEGATIDVGTWLPAPGGSSLAIRSQWPAAPSGRSARVELVQHVDAPNGGSWVVAETATSVDEVRSGSAGIPLPVPAGLAPSFDGADLACRYVVRVVVDRPMRPDASIERPVAIA